MGLREGISRERGRDGQEGSLLRESGDFIHASY